MNKMEVNYRSTRSDAAPIPASQAILKGLADDGGLFVPDQLPVLDKSLGQLAEMDYQDVAYEVMKLLLTDFSEEELRTCIRIIWNVEFSTCNANALLWLAWYARHLRDWYAVPRDEHRILLMRLQKHHEI